MTQSTRAGWASAAAVAMAAMVAAVPAAEARTFVYVSAAGGGTVDAYRLDEASGALAPLGKVEAGAKVGPLAVSPDRAHLYAAVGAQPYRVVTFAIDPQSGALREKAVAALPDAMPYIATDVTGRLLLAASYGGSSLAVLPIRADGLVLDGTRQFVPAGRNAHAIVNDRSGRYVFVPALGSDVVEQFVLNARTGMLEPNDPPSVATKPGLGPRHMALSPDGKAVYVIGELTGEVVHFTLDADSGTLRAVETVSFVPPEAGLEPGITPPPPPPFGVEASPTEPADDGRPRVWAADIAVTPNGRFLYATERTQSRIAMMTVAPDTGTLRHVSDVPTETQPRDIAIDPAGRYLVASGEKSDRLAVYAIDADNGSLTEVGRYPVSAGANWVEIVTLP
ncbi:beta-propeller fold lactonase family protein [Aureimonas sp. AU12]|uniref:lactonase family protein n=1 Tax=Aureimonas sp. AU12 TaxID=1638161 RepID=UPI000783B8D7|nr:beta-propeller fold lactonase family protein [Aureimonas sp. AU12]